MTDVAREGHESLSTRVAELMGWERSEINYHGPGWILPNNSYCKDEDFNPLESADDWMLVVAEMTGVKYGRDFDFTLRSFSGGEGPKWAAEFSAGFHVGLGEGASAGEAVCHAALAAKDDTKE